MPDDTSALLTYRQDQFEKRADAADARMERVEEKLNAIQLGLAGLAHRLEAVEKSTAGIKTTVIGTGIAVVAIVIAVLAYGQTWFGIGISSRDVIRATVLEMRQTEPAPAPVQPK